MGHGFANSSQICSMSRAPDFMREVLTTMRRGAASVATTFTVGFPELTSNWFLTNGLTNRFVEKAHWVPNIRTGSI